MDFTGKPIKGMIYVDEAGPKNIASGKKWVDLGIKFTKILPKK